MALAHLLAALRDGREDMQAVEGVVVPWTAGDHGSRSDGDPVTAAEPMPAGPGEQARASWLSGGRRVR